MLPYIPPPRDDSAARAAALQRVVDSLPPAAAPVRTAEQLADIEATQTLLASLLVARGVPDEAAKQLVAAGDYCYAHTRHGAQLGATFATGRAVFHDAAGIAAAADLLSEEHDAAIAAQAAAAQRERNQQLRLQQIAGSL